MEILSSTFSKEFLDSVIRLAESLNEENPSQICEEPFSDLKVSITEILDEEPILAIEEPRIIYLYRA